MSSSRQNSLFLKACRGEKTERTPVWLMRQAGRYMKEYRDIRAKTSFLDLCKNADLAAEVTVHAAETLGVDAGIIFSDILLILQPMGLPLEYSKGDGPVIATPIQSESDVKRLRTITAKDPLPFTSEAIRKTRKQLSDSIPLIGFCGAPFTLASYMIEGGGSKHFLKTKALMLQNPAMWNLLMEKIVRALTLSLNAQIRAGADAVQIFDSWVGCLSPADYERHVLPHMTRLLKGIQGNTPTIYFGTQTGGLLPLMKKAGSDVMGIDWREDLGATWKRIGGAVQGNLDPAVLFAEPAEVKRQTLAILKQAAGKPGHIFNLGHGVLPGTPVDHVRLLVDTVKEFRAR